MSDKVTLSTFPASELQALALLYVQNQNLSGLTPEEIYDKYRDAYKRIHDHKQKPVLNRVVVMEYFFFSLSFRFSHLLFVAYRYIIVPCRYFVNDFLSL